MEGASQTASEKDIYLSYLIYIYTCMYIIQDLHKNTVHAWMLVESKKELPIRPT